MQTKKPYQWRKEDGKLSKNEIDEKVQTMIKSNELPVDMDVWMWKNQPNNSERLEWPSGRREKEMKKK